jgi:hypothetical protein
MRAQAALFFAKNPEVSFAVLGAAENASALDLKPFSVQATFLPAEKHGDVASQYLILSEQGMGSPVPSWVLSDLHLLPGAIGLLRGPARLLDPEDRYKLGAGNDDTCILAAYVAAPTVVPGRFVGVSLLSCTHDAEYGAWVKTLTLKMLRAHRLRGVTQWSNPSVRVHTRLGPLRIVGPVPGGHELAEQSFVYECDLRDEVQWSQAMIRRLTPTPTMRVEAIDTGSLLKLVDRAGRGEKIAIVPPGLDDTGNLLFVEYPPLVGEGDDEGLVLANTAEHSIMALGVADDTEFRGRAEAIQKLLRAKYGKVSLTKTRKDLPLLQRFLDEGGVARTSGAELQNLGLAIGNVFAHELGFHWVIVAKEPALRFKSTTMLLFPVSLLSKALESGKKPDIGELFKAIEKDLARRKSEVGKA